MYEVEGAREGRLVLGLRQMPLLRGRSGGPGEDAETFRLKGRREGAEVSLPQ